MGTKSYEKFKDFTVLGADFPFAGGVEWQIVLWSRRDATMKACVVSRGVIDGKLSGDYLKAVEAAISDWTASPPA